MFKPRGPNAFAVTVCGRMVRPPESEFRRLLQGTIAPGSKRVITLRPTRPLIVDALKIVAPDRVWVQSIVSGDFEHLCNALPAGMFKGQAELIGSGRIDPKNTFKLVLVYE